MPLPYSIEKKDISPEYITHNINDLLNYYSKSDYHSSDPLKDLIFRHIIHNQIEINKDYTSLSDSSNILDSAYLRDIDFYFNKAIYCLFAYSRLISGGYKSLALTNLYYCRLNLNIVLMKIQGVSIFYFNPKEYGSFQIGKKKGKFKNPKGFHLLVRMDWEDRIYRLKKYKGSALHKSIWKIVNQCYFDFDIDGRFSISQNDIRRLFAEVVKGWRSNGRDLLVNFEYLNKRNDILYKIYGFDEIDWASGKANSIMSESEINYFDPVVYNKISNREFYQGEGLEEAELGYLILFTIELLREIQKAMKVRFIRIRKNYFDEVKTQIHIRDMVYKWLEKNNLQ